MMNLSWDDLRYFLTAARAGTVTAAGNQLGVSYTTVSRRIQQLEAQLGVLLFERTPSGYLLTAEGESIIARAEGMEDTFLSISRDLLARDAQLSGPLRVTMPEPVASILVAPHLAEFQQRFPQIRLELLIGQETLDLSAREADIAIRVTNEPPESLIGQEISKITFGVYGAGNYLDTHPDLNHPDVRYMCLPHDSGIVPKWVSKVCPKATPGIMINSLHLLVRGVAQQLGIGYLPCFIGDSDPELERVEVNYCSPPMGLWILSHTDYRNTARFKIFRTFFTEKLRQQKALIERGQFCHSDSLE
ncbi:LysR family transcriptional regulator [Motiliproteus sp. MSK22-1]|uniref:LysR family transcriptional regulator n=1 Tax=Motiliproteus sp. MSK22-1 TaxID=1897630 RepID=UPI00097584C4|nr:LysR family transcriptional regulator [Motiliproteus sp. MSK22-1]OMH38213.1 hypothetical protein BGP75_08140 [Motiliproteus sp. MSK22-1]